jgi:histidine ammonia-lyase
VALKTREIIEHCQAILAIELLNVAQAMEFRRPLKAGIGCEAAYACIRERVEPLIEDKPLYNDINAVTDLVKDGSILKAVEEAVGPLD